MQLGNLNKLSFKIPALIALASLLCGLSMAVISILWLEDTITSNYRNNFLTTLATKKEQLKDYFDGLEADVYLLSKDSTLQQATKELSIAFNDTGSELILAGYTTNNTYPTNQRDLLLASSAQSKYDLVHAKYHAWLRETAIKRNLNDILILDNQGRVVYSVYKGDDFAIDTADSNWQASTLNAIHKNSLNPESPEYKPHVYDFDDSQKDDGKPITYVSTPIKDGQNSIGSIVFEISSSKINDFLGNTKEFGETGVLYIVGSDMKLRNQPQGVPDNQEFHSTQSKRAISGETGSIFSTGLNASEVFSSYTPFQYDDLKWGIVAEINKSEIMQPIHDMAWNLILMGIALTALVGGTGLTLANRITIPLKESIDQMRLLEKNQLNFEVKYTDLSDEVGEMARALDSFKRTAISAKGLSDAQEQDKKLKEERHRKIEELLTDFKVKSSRVITAFSEAASRLQKTANTLSSVMSHAAQRSNAADVASTQASSTVKTIATASEDIAKSVERIGAQISKTKDAVDQAVSKAKNADNETVLLADASKAIGNVIQFIQNIAEQINLLALNATIESARAGEAGKGFAVVASEVKNLAQQTTDATKDIAAQIESVQSVSNKVVGVLQSITESISGVKESSAGIASAIEEQTSVTNQISLNIRNASNNVTDINDSISGVSEAMNQTNESIQELLSSATVLSKEAESLSNEIQGFLLKIQEA
jgi:methyl-accepting chemotaxis protein